jgi:hypothetical protein
MKSDGEKKHKRQGCEGIKKKKAHRKKGRKGKKRTRK